MKPQSDEVLSLFSGAGGFSYGFANAGLKPVLGVDINKDACATYEANIGSVCYNVDLSVISPSFFKDLLGQREPLAIIGGPPCQGFSTAGTRNTRDPRNQLIFNYLNIVGEIRPRWFIFENVEGLLTSGHGTALFSLISEFLRLGYSMRVHKVNLAAYGVPQTRKRVFIIGNRIGVDFRFPEELYSFESGKSKKRSIKPFAPTLYQAISGLGSAAKSRDEMVSYATLEAVNSFDEVMRKHNDTGTVTEHFHVTDFKDELRYSLLKSGQTMKNLPEEYWHDSFRRRAFRRVMDGVPTEKRGGAPSGIKRLHGNLQSLTITSAASREFIHPDENRPLTLRECARIQTFPDRYLFTGGTPSVAQQIGNAMPPLAAEALAYHLQQLDGRFGSGLQAPQSLSQPRLFGFVLTEATGMSAALQKAERLLKELQETEAV